VGATPVIIATITATITIHCALAASIDVALSADALDALVFEQLRSVLERPDFLLAAERAVIARTPAADDELLLAQSNRLERKVEAVASQRHRLVDPLSERTARARRGAEARQGN
jgi:hypothetical protein